MSRKQVLKSRYAADVDRCFELIENDGLTLTLAFERLIDDAIRDRRIRANERNVFLHGLKSAYYRAVKKKEKNHGQHGNCKLSGDEEHILVGFALALAESGEKVTHETICTMAQAFGPNKTFGKDWYVLIMLSLVALIVPMW